MSRTAIGSPIEQQPKQTGSYDSVEAQELLASLAQAEPRISQTFLYDEKGSALYEKIVEQKEYYLVEAESALVARHMDEIALPGSCAPPAGERVEEQLIVELGAGVLLCEASPVWPGRPAQTKRPIGRGWPELEAA